MAGKSIGDYPRLNSAEGIELVSWRNGTGLTPFDVLRVPITNEIGDAVDEAAAALTQQIAKVQTALEASASGTRVAQLEQTVALLQQQLAALQVGGGATASAQITGAATTRLKPATFGVTFTAISSVWIFLEKDGAQEGARVQVTAPGAAVLTPQAADDYMAVVFTAATGGTELARTTVFTVAEQPAPTVLPPIVATPSSMTFPQGTPAGTALTTLSAVPAGATRTKTTDTRFAFDNAQNHMLAGSGAQVAGTTGSITVTDTYFDTSVQPRTLTIPFTITAAETVAATGNAAVFLAGGEQMRLAYDGPTINQTSNKVTSVPNQMTGTGGLLQSNPTFQPTYVADPTQMLGGPSIEFTNTNAATISPAFLTSEPGQLVLPDNDLNFMIAGTAYVGNINVAPTTGHDSLFTYTADGEDWFYDASAKTTSFKLGLHWNNTFNLYRSGGSANVVGAVPFLSNSKLVWCIVVKNGVGQLRINNSVGPTFPFGGTMPGGRITLGRSPRFSNPSVIRDDTAGLNTTPFKGRMRHLVIRTNPDDALAVMDYLGSKIGLTLNLSNPATGTEPGGVTDPGTGGGGGTTTNPPAVPAVDSAYPVTTFTAISNPLEGTGAPAGSVHTQGIVFQRGHVKPGDAVCYRTAGGTNVETQMDAATQTYWGDGSIRFTAIHTVPPTLADTVKDNGTFVKVAGPTSAAINLATALSGRSAVVEIKNGSNVFTHDVFANIPSERWFQGSLKSSFRKYVAIPRTAVGGVPDCTLQIDAGIDKAGIAFCHAQVTNFNVYVSAYGDAFFDYKLTCDGQPLIQYTGIKVPMYTAYSPAEVRWAAGGAKRGRPFYHNPDTAYYSRTGVIYNYDKQLGVPESMLATWTTRRASAYWSVPMNERNLKKSMGDQGGNDDLGWATKSQSSWLISGDRRAVEYFVDQADAAFGIPMFHRNPKYNNRWVNPVDQPWARLAYHDSAYRESSSIKRDNNPGGWGIDLGHWGDYFLVPYLATAQRAFCDGAIGAACFSVMEKNPGQERLIPSATDADTEAGRTARLAAIANDGKGMDMRHFVQIRTTGWSDRSHANAIAIVPASETPYGDLFMRGKIGLFKRMLGEIPQAQVNQKNAYGFPLYNAWVDGENGLASPWQAIFVHGSYIKMARLEVPGALEYLNWAQNYSLGGFSHPDMDHGSMTKYRLKMTSSGSQHGPSSTLWNSWAAIKAQLGTGAYGNNWDGPGAGQIAGIGDYERRYFAFITQFYDLLSDHGKNTTLAAAAHAKAEGAPKGVTFTNDSDYKNEAQNSITRRGQTRL